MIGKIISFVLGILVGTLFGRKIIEVVIPFIWDKIGNLNGI